jgi:uncharacterized protein (DUF362 family)
MGLDAGAFGTPEWNPLGDVIRRGDTVVLKPNLVSHFNHGSGRHLGGDTDSLVTHGSVVRVVADYAVRAAGPGGTVIICDCPLQGTDWDAVVRLTGLDAVVECLRTAFPNTDVRLLDYRLGRAVMRGAAVVARKVDDSRIRDYTEVDLGTRSLLASDGFPGPGFGVTQYGSERMRAAHTSCVNNYLFPNDILKADVFINLPKMKTHVKTGVTCALKNLVGINGHKDYLPHFRYGSPSTGGDEYPDGNWWWNLTWSVIHREWELPSGRRKALLRTLARVLRRLSPVIGGFSSQRYRMGGGSWPGNDTAWRMVLDINRALFYYDRNVGEVQTEPFPGVSYLTIVDALVAGEGEGPLSPSPVPCGILLASFNPVAADTVAATAMGFEPQLLPMIESAYHLANLSLANFAPSDITVVGEDGTGSLSSLPVRGGRRHFAPPSAFLGLIERDPSAGD